MSILPRGVILATCLFALAACDSAEERAEKHFQSGLELLETGDVSRALLEFRNALSLDESHREARVTYARAARENGNFPEAYSNYLRIAEEFPDDAEARLALAEMAILAQNWEEAERHAEAFFKTGDSSERGDVLRLAIDFRAAAVAEDSPRIRELTRQAEQLAETYPNDDIIVRALIEGYLNDNRVDEAIAAASSMLDSGTDNTLFYDILSELLVAKGDPDELEAHFRRMLEKFPNDKNTKSNLIGLLIGEGRGEQAEAFLRDEIAKAEDKPSAHVSLIALRRQLAGDDAALAEIETALAAYDSPPLIVALKAGLLFDRGDRDDAVSLMQGITDGKEPSAQVDEFKVTLAKMLIATGNEVGARQLVEAVLEHDAGQVEALKMQANWQIDADEADEAIATLRLALDGAPDDAEAMTLMARAHERNGEAQLARDLLALAVEASGNAPAESLRFARTQMEQGRFSTAEEALINALRRRPGQPNLLDALGQVYLATADWGRATQVVDTLRRIDTEATRVAADNLQLQIITQREGREQGVGFLEQLVQSSSGSTAARVALIQARLRDGQSTEALNLARELAADLPDDPAATLVLGNTQLALADFAGAETTFRAMKDADPNNIGAVIQLLRALSAQDRPDEAASLIDEALVSQPDNPDLLWARASLLERANDIDGAIEVYERIYAGNSENQVVANNLASLLVTYRTDEASLDRAITVGKRLRGTAFPPFQDTYGWLLYRQGEFDEAVTYLEPAAEALADDPIVQFHLAKSYLALERNADALAQFEKVVAVAGESDPRPQVAEAVAEIQRLSAASE